MAGGTGYRSTSGLLVPPTRPPVYLKKLAVLTPSSNIGRRSTSGAFKMTFSPDSSWVSNNMGEVGNLLVKLANSGIRRVAFKASSQLAKNSRQLKSKSIADSWKVRPIGHSDIKLVNTATGAAMGAGSLLFGYGIYSDHPRAYKPITLRSGFKTDLLEMLEYGTRPHRIKPRNAPQLKFFWEDASPDLPIKNTKTFLGYKGQAVDHPGTRPYGFIRIAVAQAAGEMIAVLYALRAVKFLIGR